MNENDFYFDEEDRQFKDNLHLVFKVIIFPYLIISFVQFDLAIWNWDSIYRLIFLLLSGMLCINLKLKERNDDYKE